jgi:hypothetical protein
MKEFCYEIFVKSFDLLRDVIRFPTEVRHNAACTLEVLDGRRSLQALSHSCYVALLHAAH